MFKAWLTTSPPILAYCAVAVAKQYSEQEAYHMLVIQTNPYQHCTEMVQSQVLKLDTAKLCLNVLHFFGTFKYINITASVA